MILSGMRAIYYGSIHRYNPDFEEFVASTEGASCHCSRTHSKFVDNLTRGRRLVRFRQMSDRTDRKRVEEAVFTAFPAAARFGGWPTYGSLSTTTPCVARCTRDGDCPATGPSGGTPREGSRPRPLPSLSWRLDVAFRWRRAFLVRIHRCAPAGRPLLGVPSASSRRDDLALCLNANTSSCRHLRVDLGRDLRSSDLVRRGARNRFNPRDFGDTHLASGSPLESDPGGSCARGLSTALEVFPCDP